MTSPNDGSFPSIPIRNDPPTAAPSNYLDEFLTEMKILNSDNTDISLDSNEIKDLLDGLDDGLGQTQPTTFHGVLLYLLEQPIYSSEDDKVNDQSKATNPTGIDILSFNSDGIDDFFNELIEDPDQVQTELFDGELPNLLEQSTYSSEDDIVNNQSKATNPTGIDFDERIDGLDQAETELFGGEPPNLPEQSTNSSEDDALNNHSEAASPTETDAVLFKKSDFNSRSNFVNCTRLFRTGQTLRIRTPPYPYQRIQYEKDLKKKDNAIYPPRMFELRNRISAKTLVFMRVTRTTTPYGPDSIILCHPYPLWVKDKHAKVHHGSLLFDITDQIRNNQSIRFEHLMLVRLKQNLLKNISQWPIYTSNQLDHNGLHSVNISKPKRIIEHYNLRYSVLHFQIILIDENRIAYPTDLVCETTSMFEYKDEDRPNHPDYLPPERKRLQQQQKSSTAQQKNNSKNIKQVKKKYTDGAHPHNKRRTY